MKRVWIPLVIVSLVIWGIIGAVTWRGDRADEARDRRIDALVVEMAGFDPVVIELDAAVLSETTTQTASESDALLSRVASATADIERLQADAITVRSEYARISETRLDVIDIALAGRAELLRIGARIVTADAAAARAVDALDRALVDVIAAGEHGAAGVDAANMLNPEGLAASAAENAAAAQRLTSAKAAVAEVDEPLAAGMVSDFARYIDAKIESNRIAQETDAALAAGDIASANQLTETFNAAEASAAEIAHRLVLSPGAMIKDAYAQQVEGLLDEYRTARERTAQADSQIRE